MADAKTELERLKLTPPTVTAVLAERTLLIDQKLAGGLSVADAARLEFLRWVLDLVDEVELLRAAKHAVVQKDVRRDRQRK